VCGVGGGTAGFITRRKCDPQRYQECSKTILPRARAAAPCAFLEILVGSAPDACKRASIRKETVRSKVRKRHNHTASKGTSFRRGQSSGHKSEQRFLGEHQTATRTCRRLRQQDTLGQQRALSAGVKLLEQAESRFPSNARGRRHQQARQIQHDDPPHRTTCESKTTRLDARCRSSFPRSIEPHGPAGCPPTGYSSGKIGSTPRRNASKRVGPVEWLTWLQKSERAGR